MGLFLSKLQIGNFFAIIHTKSSLKEILHMSAFQTIQSLLQEKADCQARIKIHKLAII
jgi:hypothetical protein